MKKFISQGIATLKQGGAIKPSPTAALDSFRMLVDAQRDYKKTVELETSKREAIAAWRDVRLIDLENRRASLEGYLTHRFAERRYMIEEMFQRLDRGIDEKNDQLITGALGAIVDIARQSPLADVDKLIGDIDSPNVPSIEI